jgi:STE24 endopeptidase
LLQLLGKLDFDVLRSRQYKYYSKQEPPDILKEHVPLDKFHKSQVYGRDKAKFSFVKTIYAQIWDTLFIYRGGFAHCWNGAGLVMASLGFSPKNEVSGIPKSTLHIF